MYKIIDFSDERPSQVKKLQIGNRNFTLIRGFLIGEVGDIIYKIPAKLGITQNYDMMFYIDPEGVFCDDLLQD